MLNFNSPWLTALKLARVSSPNLTNLPTALTSLVAVPLLELLFLLALSASLGAANLLHIAYASVLLGLGTSILAGTVGQVSYDRMSGVLQDTLAYRFFYLPYWGSKIFVPALLGLAVAVSSCLGIFLLDPEHQLDAFLAALALLLPVALLMGLASVGVATLSLGLKDPYLLSNILGGLLPLTAGVLVPLSLYPSWLAQLVTFLPLTASVEAFRLLAEGGPVTGVLFLLAREALVSCLWLLVGVAASRLVMSALRSGRRRQEIW